ncbi:Hypothetical protein NTJ_07974 [Nesidiocoris tenuis]|uniref:Uncharacterized protein n=1 Tax=Nesidiocoris tenuis TaxID=355587 RepID=A0ABN7ASJ1_9HEMI|nr:Hypothetical protein NTJ_07974 [Nesidiocoris tenuis]
MANCCKLAASAGKAAREKRAARGGGGGREKRRFPSRAGGRGCDPFRSLFLERGHRGFPAKSGGAVATRYRADETISVRRREVQCDGRPTGRSFFAPRGGDRGFWGAFPPRGWRDPRREGSARGGIREFAVPTFPRDY